MDAYVKSLHHVGVVVRDIEAATRWHVDRLGYQPEGPLIDEPIQKVFVQFLLLGGFRVELLQPSSESSPVMAFLSKGGHLNHLCYETDDLDAAVAGYRRHYRAFPTFIGWSASMERGRVAFVARPSGEIVELVQFVPDGPTCREAIQAWRESANEDSLILG